MMGKRGRRSIANPLTYTGREYDSSTGLYYYRARYYNPGVGRFISVDPLIRQFARSYAGSSALSGGSGGCGSCGGLGRGSIPQVSSLPSTPLRWLHPYTYVNNNPVNYVDPEGLWISRGEFYWLMLRSSQQIKEYLIVPFTEAERIPELWPFGRTGRITQSFANRILGKIFFYNMANQIPLPKWAGKIKDLAQKIYQLLNSVTKKRIEYAKVEVPSWKATILIAWDRCGEIRMPVLWYSEEGENPWGYKAFIVDLWSKTPKDISKVWPSKYNINLLYYYPPEALKRK